jgi:uncharacterized protein involved in exopolysaccharide biosynthesis
MLEMPSQPLPPEWERPVAPPRGSWVALLEQHTRLLLGAAALGALGGVALATALPAWYQAQARLAILPVEDPTGSQGNVIDGANATLPIVVAVLHSRPVADETVVRLGLTTAWGARNDEAARAELAAHLTVSPDRKSNMVTLAVEDRVASRAQSIVETMAEVASTRAAELWGAGARVERRRLEAELEQVGARLAAAEAGLRDFRERTGAVNLPVQIKATVEEAAALTRLRIDKDVQLRLARGFGDEQAVEVRRAERERDAAERALTALRRKGDGTLLGLEALPALEAEEAQRRREIDRLAARHELLALKVSQLVAGEARPGGRAELIDPPSLPRERARPSRLGLGAEGAAGSLLLTALALLLRRRGRRG